MQPPQNQLLRNHAKTVNASEYRHQLTECHWLVAPGAADQLDFEAFETHLRRQALQLAARAVERRLNADHSDHTGPTAACACGQRARYAGRHAKTFEASLGPLTLERAYYHCGHCGGGFFPRDMALGMARTSLSPAVTRMTAAAAARVSFAQAGQLLAELAGVQVGAKRVERTAEALGCEIAAAERREVFAPEEPSASTMYLGADGTGVPMRPHEVAGRAGKQSDGSARTREGKVIVLWTAEGRDEHDHAVRDAGSVTYSAAIDSAAWRDTDPLPPAFVRRLRREAERRGFDRAQRKVIMGDGAKWIWSVATELYPSAIQIVDFFHACEKVWEVAKALFPGDAASPCRELRGRRQVRRLHRDQPRAHALPRVPRPRPAHRLRGGGRRLQVGGRRPPQAGRHEVDQGRCRRRHGPAQLHPERALRGLLGMALQGPVQGRGLTAGCPRDTF